MTLKTKITIIGAGYVGMSLAVLLAQKNKVTIFDIDKEKVDKINNNKSTVLDPDILEYMGSQRLSINATTEKQIAYADAKFIVVATPTDYNIKTSNFDTSSVDNVIEEALHFNKEAVIVIKSTIPVGHTKYLQEKFQTKKIIFSPEFLREGRALKDNLYPSRIIIDNENHYGEEFSNLLKQGALKEDIKILFVSSTEAEAIKLFANTYLAMRISFFNELDSYALTHKLDTKDIITGVCLDSRIGEGYNNPSFGYGGYCLPKDTKQLLANYEQVPQTLIEAIVSSNSTRKDFIADKILQMKPKTIGFHRLVMKKGSDNFRSSAILGIIERITSKDTIVLIYEPSLTQDTYHGSKVCNNIKEFKESSDIIISNRLTADLDDVIEKVFSRDVFQEN